MPSDQSSPTRVFATLSGALLVIGGTIGFFASSSFETPGEVAETLGVFDVNGWLNTLHIVIGVLGLLAAGFAPRIYALAAGLLFAALAIWGLALGGGDAILDRLPADDAENVLHAVLAGLGLAAAFAERPRVSEKRKAERRQERERRANRKKRDRREKRERRARSAARKQRESAKSESGDRSRRPEGDRDSGDRGDEPRKGRGRRSQRRPRPPRPPA